MWNLFIFELCIKNAATYVYLFILAGCRPFLPPENGYYVNDIRQIYYANSSMDSIQVACEDGYSLVDSSGNGASNGIAICQSDGSWSQEFYCLGEYQYNMCAQDFRFHNILCCIQSLLNFSMDSKDLLEECLFKVKVLFGQFVIEIGT